MRRAPCVTRVQEILRDAAAQKGVDSVFKVWTAARQISSHLRLTFYLQEQVEKKEGMFGGFGADVLGW